MRHICEICGKHPRSANKLSYRGTQMTKRVGRTQYPNVQRVKVIDNGTVKHVSVCTRCMRSGKIVRAM